MKKFKIPSVPPTTNKCIRFPNDIIDAVEKAIEGKNCTFTPYFVPFLHFYPYFRPFFYSFRHRVAYMSGQNNLYLNFL